MFLEVQGKQGDIVRRCNVIFPRRSIKISYPLSQVTYSGIASTIMTDRGGGKYEYQDHKSANWVGVHSYIRVLPD